MPLYGFKDDETGREVRVMFPMAEAPRWGELIPGTNLRRMVELPQRSTVRDYTFRAYSQPPWAEGAPAYDNDGTPCFTSKAEIRRYVDRQNALVEKDGTGQQGGEYIQYDAI